MLHTLQRSTLVVLLVAFLGGTLALPANAGGVDTKSPLPTTARATIKEFGSVPSPQRNHQREGRYTVVVTAGKDQANYNPGAWITLEFCPTSISTRCPGGWLPLPKNDEQVSWSKDQRTVTLTGEFPKHFGATAVRITVRAKVVRRDPATGKVKVHNATLGPLKTVVRGSDIDITPSEVRG